MLIIVWLFLCLPPFLWHLVSRGNSLTYTSHVIIYREGCVCPCARGGVGGMGSFDARCMGRDARAALCCVGRMLRKVAMVLSRGCQSAHAGLANQLGC